MRVSESCAQCLYKRQEKKTDNEAYLAEIRRIIDNRRENDSSPYLVYLFNKTHLKYFGEFPSFKDVKIRYNDLVLEKEELLRNEIAESDDPLAKALIMARIGNYIDFGPMNNVTPEEFLALFNDTSMREDDAKTYESFVKECENGKKLLLICDNCGEIVLDKLLIEQLKIRFPHLEITAMVRGGDVLNDVTMEDAVYVGLDKVAKVIDNGAAVSGTVYDMLSAGAAKELDGADIILSKGQGNYESLSGQGRHVFYMFLCKCELFTGMFNVEKYTGMFIEE